MKDSPTQPPPVAENQADSDELIRLLLDSTGEVSREVLPLSERPDWEPLRLFDETSAFAARKR